MEKVAIKNRMMFFGGAAIVGVIAIFIFSVSQARAYAIGSVPSSSGPVPTAPAAPTTAGSSYNAGNSLQNLVSPFTNFINSLKWNNNTTINTGAQAPGFVVTNFTPGVENTIQSTVSGWLSQFDNWFYGISGVRLSGIFYILLNAIAWTLGLAERVVNWLLGLFH